MTATTASSAGAGRSGASALGRLDAALGRVTMYRFVWLVLAAIGIICLGYSLAGIISFTPVELVASAATAIVSTTAVSWLFARALRTRAHLESSIITGLLIFFLFLPTLDPVGLGLIALVGAVAAASKFVLAWRGRHILNPAAIGAVVVGLTQLTAAGWWVASAQLWPYVVLGALLVLHRTHRLAMGLTFIVVAVAITSVRLVSFGTAPLEAVGTAITSYPFVFLAGFMLSEPLTTPPRRWQQLTIALIAGLLAALPFSIGTAFYSSPEFALVVANIVAFVFGQRRSVRLELVERRALTPSTTEFLFRPGAAVRFRPGQYVEVTVPHKADSRGSRRTFSIASHPSNDGTVALAMRVPEKASSFKRALVELPTGTVVRATSVGGDFVLPTDPAVPLLLVAGGIGITPFASQLAELASRGEKRDVVVVYSTGSAADLAYAQVLTDAGARVHLVSPEPDGALPADWTHLGSGRLTAERLTAAVPDVADRRAYVSGPPEMVNGLARVLRAAGARRVKTDYFSGY